MKREVVDCDGCSITSVPSHGHLSVETWRGLDGSGSSDTWEEYVDLCPKCMARQLQKFLDKLDHKEAADWFHEVTLKTCAKF